MKQTIKFRTLSHQGPVFCEAYHTRGPFSVNGVELPLNAEEMLWHYSRYATTEYAARPNFTTNFMIDFRRALPKELQTLDILVFNPLMETMRSIQHKEKEVKAARSKEDRAAEKVAKEALKTKHGTCIMDGKEQPLATFMTEPAGIFLGRGNHPLLGRWKKAITPEDIEINVVGSKEPNPPVGHKWGKITQNKTGYYAWVVHVTVGDTVLDKRAVIDGEVKTNSVMEKYEKAQIMNQKWSDLQKHIKAGLATHDEAAIVAWLIEHTAMRVGGERGAHEAQDVVGATTLLVRNVKLSCQE